MVLLGFEVAILSIVLNRVYDG